MATPNPHRPSHVKQRQKTPLAEAFFNAIDAIKHNNLEELKKIFDGLPLEEQKLLLLSKHQSTQGAITTLLISAICVESVPIIQYLVGVLRQLPQNIISETERKAWIETSDSKGNSPLMYAFRSQKEEVCAAIIAGGAHVNPTSASRALILAVQEGAIALMELLIQHGANVNAYDDYGNPILCVAAHFNRIPAAKLLLTHKANINAQGLQNQFSALHIAVSAGHLEMVQFLLDNGIEPNLQDHQGWTAVHTSAMKNHVPCLEVFHKRDRKLLDLETVDGITPLLAAASVGALDTLRYCCENGADMTKTHIAGSNCLAVAISNSQGKAVRFLATKNILWQPIPIKTLLPAGFQQASLLLGGGPRSKAQCSQQLNLPENAKLKRVLFDTTQESNYFEVSPMSPIEFAVGQCSNEQTNKIFKLLLSLHQVEVPSTPEDFKMEAEFSQSNPKKPFGVLKLRNFLRGDGGSKLLFIAAERGQLRVIQDLITVGADIRKIRSKGGVSRTVLMAASAQKHSEETSGKIENSQYDELVEDLIERSKLLDKEDGQHQSWLNKTDGDPLWNAVTYASTYGSARALRSLIKAGVEVKPYHLNRHNLFASEDTKEYTEKMAILLRARLTKALGCSFEDAREELQVLIEFIVQDHQNLVSLDSGELVLLLDLKSRSIQVNITPENVAQIVKEIKDLLETCVHERTKRTLFQKIKKVLLPYNIRAAEVKKLEESEALRDNFDEIMLKARFNLGTTNAKIQEIKQAISQAIMRIEASIKLNQDTMQSQNYQSKYPERKAQIEALNQKFQESLVTIKATLEKLRGFKNHPLNVDLRKETIDRYQQLMGEHAKNGYENAKAYVNSLKESYQEICRTEIEAYEQVHTKVQALLVEAQDIINKQDALKIESTLSSKKIKGGGKKKSKTNAQKQAKAKELAREKQKLAEQSSDVDLKVVRELAKGRQSSFGSDAELMEEVLKDLDQDVREADKKKFQEFADKERARNVLTTPKDWQPLAQEGPRTLADQLESRLELKERETEVRRRLENRDTKPSSEAAHTQAKTSWVATEQILEPWRLLGTLAHRMEGLKNSYGELFPRAVADRIRDLIFYFSNVSQLFTFDALKTINENLTGYFSEYITKGTNGKYSSLAELFNDIDPPKALNRTGSLAKMLTMEYDAITPKFCKKRIQEGYLLWKQCQDLYVESKGDCDINLLKMSMGFAVGIIGNFASHLRRDHQFDNKQINEILEAAQTHAKVLLPWNVQKCIDVGKKFRHLNKIKEGKKFKKATVSWEQDLDEHLALWSAQLKVRAVPALPGTTQAVPMQPIPATTQPATAPLQQPVPATGDSVTTGTKTPPLPAFEASKAAPKQVSKTDDDDVFRPFVFNVSRR